MAICLGILLLTFSPSIQAASVLSSQHCDFRVSYDATAGRLTNIFIWNRDATPEEILQAKDVALVVKQAAKLTLPFDLPPLGLDGDSVWILPATQDPNLLFLGLSGEDPTLADVFPGVINFTLTATRGRGNFFLWQAGQFGDLDFQMVAITNQVTSTNTIAAFVGSHAHYNWGFSTSGVFQATFQTSGMRAGETTNIFGPPTTFTFFVEPLRPFESWQTNHWPVYGPDALVGPGADPDGDGVANLLEYAFNTNPLQAGVTNLPVYSLTNIAGTTYAALSFLRKKTATDLVYHPEAATNPSGPWQAMTNLLSTVDLGTTERLLYRDLVPLNATANRFAHVRVELK